MKKILIMVLTLGLMTGANVMASSHREAPSILKRPQVDGTDFYMFRSYEQSRQDYVTIIADYNPLQDPYGGPNYFPLDTNAAYDIHINNDKNPREDLTFRFRFKQELKGISIPVGDQDPVSVAIPLVNAGSFGAEGEDALNVIRSYTVELIKGSSLNEDSKGKKLKDTKTGAKEFRMPFDNIGNKSIPDYDAYAQQFIYDVEIPGCSEAPGRLFVGQRKEPFAVNLGETFDLVNITNPLGAVDAERSSTEDKNITSLILEVPTKCLVKNENNPVIAGWTTAKLPKVSLLRKFPSYNDSDKQEGDLVQVSRLANPLVNEVAIGLPDKDLFNASQPKDDAQFLKYVTNPTLPELLEILFFDAGVRAPNLFPRNDLVQVFLTGVPGLNEDGSVGEMMRLNTSIAPVAKDQQNNLGVIGGDLAGYPNGRRPGDDTVDISLRAVMGVLLPADVAPSKDLPFTDGALQNADQFDDVFPYLRTPIAGSPNDTP